MKPEVEVTEPRDAAVETPMPETEPTETESPESDSAPREGAEAAEPTEGPTGVPADEPADGEPAEGELAAEESGPAAEEDSDEEDAKGPGPGEDLTDDELVRAVAALVFASPDPLGTIRLWNLLERPRKERVKAAMQELGKRLEAAGLPFELRPIAGGWRLLTTPDHAEVVMRLSKVRKNERISPAALETLAIVAYRQPVTKAEIEAIRGVQAGALLRSLSERGLVRVSGRADQPGSPLQYGTTKEFLDRFGLEGLKDLPRDGELLSS